MPIFKKKSESDGASDAQAQPPDERLVDQVEWRRQLDGEIWRAGRYERPLSVLCFAQQLLPGEHAAEHELQGGATRVAQHLRRVDRAAVLQETIVALLPETDAVAAQVVAQRIASDLSVASMGQRTRKWLAGVASMPGDGERDDQLVGAATRRARDR